MSSDRPGSRPVRIANCSGFYGDRLSAMTEMLHGGPVDVVTGDYLAELTMLILARQRAKDPAKGYAITFLAQLRENLDVIVRKDVKVVVNAGGMNPQGLAEAVEGLAKEAGLDVSVATVCGDDLTERASELGLGEPIAANAYLGAYGIVHALNSGAQIVVTGRVTDASVIVGAAAWWHEWDRENYDAIAGAMAAGHVIECGAQATGGNFSFFREIPHMTRPGFPIAEVAADGSSVITKHSDTDGAVTEETVLSQLLYEIQGARYAGPDAVLRLDSITLEQLGNDRVGITGAVGEAPPPDLKVSVTELGGYLNEMVWMITGLNAREKADLVRHQFDAALTEKPAEVKWSFAHAQPGCATTQEEATSVLRVLARDPDPAKGGRAFSNVGVELALASYPGTFMQRPPEAGKVYGRYRAAYVPQDTPNHTVILADGTHTTITPPRSTQKLAPTSADSHYPPAPDQTPEQGGTEGSRVHLGDVFGARSGDKGGDANIGIWARNEAGYAWLKRNMTVELLRTLLPEARELEVERTELDNLGAINFVVHGILGEGVASQARFDPQAKGLGEYVRSRTVTLPEDVLTAPVTRGRNTNSHTE